MTTTVFVVFFLVVIPLGWEMYTLTQSDVQTISEVMSGLGRQWNPFVMYIVSVLVGHFWLHPEESLAKYLGEGAEVFIVMVVGWTIFWVFQANGQWLPLTNRDSVMIILGGILVGAYAWTMGV